MRNLPGQESGRTPPLAGAPRPEAEAATDVPFTAARPLFPAADATRRGQVADARVACEDELAGSQSVLLELRVVRGQEEPLRALLPAAHRVAGNRELVQKARTLVRRRRYPDPIGVGLVVPVAQEQHDRVADVD